MTYAVLSGAGLALGTVVALLFFRAFARTRDRLFFFFGIAFVLLALERLALVATGQPELNLPAAYVPRIVAFALIAIAIVDRNRR